MSLLPLKLEIVKYLHFRVLFKISPHEKKSCIFEVYIRRVDPTNLTPNLCGGSHKHICDCQDKSL